MSMYGDARRRPVLDCSADKVRVKQAMKDECDINNIIRRYRETGQVSHVARTPGVFADVSGVQSLRDSLHQVEIAQRYFEGLAARTRERFDNDAVKFLEFMETASQEDLKKAGLLKAKERVAAEAAAPGADDASEASDSSSSEASEA